MKRKNEVGWREGLSLPRPDYAALQRRVLENSGERGFAVIYACLVEDVIADLIAKVLDSPIQNMLDDAQAGLHTFSAKIKMGRALRLYGDAAAHDLDTVRKIRNKCAHTFGIRCIANGTEQIVPLSFSDEPLRSLCETLSLVDRGVFPFSVPDADRATPLGRYRATCVGIGSALLRADWHVARINPVLP